MKLIKSTAKIGGCAIQSQNKIYTTMNLAKDKEYKKSYTQLNTSRRFVAKQHPQCGHRYTIYTLLQDCLQTHHAELAVSNLILQKYSIKISHQNTHNFDVHFCGTEFTVVGDYPW